MATSRYSSAPLKIFRMRVWSDCSCCCVRCCLANRIRLTVQRRQTHRRLRKSMILPLLWLLLRSWRSQHSEHSNSNSTATTTATATATATTTAVCCELPSCISQLARRCRNNSVVCACLVYHIPARCSQFACYPRRVCCYCYHASYRSCCCRSCRCCLGRKQTPGGCYCRGGGRNTQRVGKVRVIAARVLRFVCCFVCLLVYVCLYWCSLRICLFICLVRGRLIMDVTHVPSNS